MGLSVGTPARVLRMWPQLPPMMVERFLEQVSQEQGSQGTQAETIRTFTI